MKVKSIKIHNILSIEDAELNFNDTGLTLVEGWNYDDNRSTGSGKSSIFNALSFAIYDKVPRKITKTEILRNSTKDGYVFVKFSVNEDTYEIRRYRPSNLEIYKNDSLIIMTQEELEKNIRLSYTQFISTMYTPQDSADKFISLNDKDKKDFILGLMNLEAFNDHSIKIKGEISSYDTKINKLQNNISTLNSNLDIYISQLIDESETQKKLHSNSTQIKILSNDIDELSLVEQPDFSKYQDIEEKIQISIEKFTELEFKRRELISLLDILKSNSNKQFYYNKVCVDDRCPKCQAELSINGKRVFAIEDTSAQEQEALSIFNSEIEVIKAQIKDTIFNINEIDKKLQDKDKIKQLKHKLDNKKIQDRSDYSDARSKISEISGNIKILITNNKYLQEKLDNNQNNITTINKIKEEITNLNILLEQSEKRREILEAIQAIFSPTGAPAYIMDSAIESFNDRVVEYIQLIWPNASYQLLSSKTNKDGKISTKFSELLIIDGKERSLGSLSGGELRSISLSLDFAILDTLENTFGIGINPIILDEPFTGLDSSGREIVMGLLSKISESKQILVIDHSTETKSAFDSVIRIEKRNGKSSIVV